MIGEAVRLHDLFACEGGSTSSLQGATFRRNKFELTGNVEVITDRFDDSGAECSFLRFRTDISSTLTIVTAGEYSVYTPQAGGWLLKSGNLEGDTYWVPCAPVLRSLDAQGHIQSHCGATISAVGVSSSGMELTLEAPPGLVVDLVVWRVPGNEQELLESFDHLTVLEQQKYFLWSSHTAYSKPADLYLHLVHGHVYENHEVWPKYWRVCSELDAYALYVTLTGLKRATGKGVYDLLRRQVVFSVIARQAKDGGWYHGEWTEQMESHYRLHSGAMHMLAACLEETNDPAVGEALQRASAFAASKIDRLDAGPWYLHDSLEENMETLKSYPFRYVASRALGKSESNLLVLNTHLDTNIAMERCRRISGDTSYDSLIASARDTAHTVLNSKPAEWLYRPLFKAIELTFLPSEQGASLPLLLRAVKRVAWKYLAPQLPRLKARFPRLVMPGGYIERDLVQCGMAVRYQPVNLMDLIRTRRLFDEPELDSLLEESFSFTLRSGLKDRWKELKGKEDDSLGFWAEALYHLCLSNPDERYREWLAEAIMDLEDNSLGLSPSLLGANAEAMAPDQQYPCPSVDDPRVRLANLSQGENIELLMVNPSSETVDFEWELEPVGELIWKVGDAKTLAQAELPSSISPRNWVWGMSRS